MNQYQSLISGQPILKDDYDDNDREAVYEALKRRRRKAMADQGIIDFSEENEPQTGGLING